MKNDNDLPPGAITDATYSPLNFRQARGKYEYSTSYLYDEDGMPDDEWMNGKGAEGWRIVAATGNWIIFMRELE